MSAQPATMAGTSDEPQAEGCGGGLADPVGDLARFIAEGVGEGSTVVTDETGDCDADVPVTFVVPSAPSASVKQAFPAGIPGQSGSSESWKCAAEPGRTRSSRPSTAAVLPARCGGNVAAPGPPAALR